MSVFEHARFRIFNPAQHPLKHDISDFAYINPRLPNITTLSDTIDYVVSVLYPNYIGTFATAAALPLTSNPNDYAIVSDDGSGHAAGYVWSKIDNAGQWIKRYDMTWSMDSILAETINRTEYMYVQKFGLDDRDANGNTVTGTYAGQTIFGGATAGNNLTLSANSGDANSLTHSGYVQVDDHFRPTQDNTYTSGTATNRWSQIYTLQAQAGTLTLSGGSISDSSGAISFGSNNLSTTGNLSANSLSATTQATVANLTLTTGSITSGSGALSLGSNTLSTTGTVSGGSGSQFGNLTLTNGQITSASGSLSFGGNNLSTTGSLSAGATTLTSLTAGNLSLAGNTLSATNVNGSITLTPAGSGNVTVAGSLQVNSNSNVTGNVVITGSWQAGNLAVSTNTLSSTNLNGTITVSPNGSGLVAFGSGIYPVTTAAQDSGKSGNLWNYLWLSGGIKDGSHTLAITDLMTLRNASFRDTGRTQPAQTGDALFYDAVSGTWLASVPDSEIVHNTLSGLTNGDAGHTQFVMLAGRAGGQLIQGGTAASENLTIESTANATKGSIFVKDPVRPLTNASYSAGWSGTDLGGTANYFKDVYTKGQFFGMRLENVTSSALPSAAASNAGRLVFATDTKKIYVDTGTAMIVAGVGKYLADQAFDGTTTQYDITVSASIQDARNAIWQLCDNTNNYERVFCKIQATSATNVRVIASPALPAGSYRLIGLE